MSTSKVKLWNKFQQVRKKKILLIVWSDQQIISMASQYVHNRINKKRQPTFFSWTIKIYTFQSLQNLPTNSVSEETGGYNESFPKPNNGEAG